MYISQHRYCESQYYLVTITSSCLGIRTYIYSLPHLLILICYNYNKTNRTNAMNIPYYIYCKHDLLKQTETLHQASESLCVILSLPG